MQRDMEGRVAFVTGGASGIGAATARLFGARGACVVIADRSEEAANALAEDLRRQGTEAAAIIVDLASEESVEYAIAETQARFGRLDYCFNNAGIGGGGGPFDQIELESWSRIIAVNLTAVFLCMKHQLRLMAEAGRGSIVNTSSGAGLVAAPFAPAYTAAKHGVLGLTKVAAREYAARGIRVNAICPGIIETPMSKPFVAPGSDMERQMLAAMPIGRFGKPEEVAELVVWLSSDNASFVSGESIVIDGGSLCR